jgi:hypothetical protein
MVDFLFLWRWWRWTSIFSGLRAWDGGSTRSDFFPEPPKVHEKVMLATTSTIPSNHPHTSHIMAWTMQLSEESKVHQHRGMKAMKQQLIPQQERIARVIDLSRVAIH